MYKSLEPSGNKPLTDATLTLIYDALWHHLANMSSCSREKMYRKEMLEVSIVVEHWNYKSLSRTITFNSLKPDLIGNQLKQFQCAHMTSLLFSYVITPKVRFYISKCLATTRHQPTRPFISNCSSSCFLFVNSQNAAKFHEISSETLKCCTISEVIHNYQWLTIRIWKWNHIQLSCQHCTSRWPSTIWC